eukprot:UN06949
MSQACEITFLLSPSRLLAPHCSFTKSLTSRNLFNFQPLHVTNSALYSTSDLIAIKNRDRIKANSFMISYGFLIFFEGRKFFS